jgi:hypothetical protein
MSAFEKQVAIQRIQAPQNDVGLMPPKRFGTLSPGDIQKLTEYLQQ